MAAMQPIFMMLAMFGIFYFILIRPQVKKQREHQAMLEKLGKGDEIVTRGGMIGKITGLQSDVVIIELQEKVRVRVPRAYIDGRWTAAKAADTTKAEKSEKSEKVESAA